MTRPARLPTARQAELAAAIAPAPEGAELRRARKLKTAIKAYWRERGCDIDLSIEPVRLRSSPNKAQFDTFYALKSNTLNGQPIGGAR